MIFLSNYEKMYKILFNAAEDAINILIKAQQKCEDIYVSEISITKQLEKREIEKTLELLSNVKEKK